MDVDKITNFHLWWAIALLGRRFPLLTVSMVGLTMLMLRLDELLVGMQLLYTELVTLVLSCRKATRSDVGIHVGDSDGETQVRY